MQEGNPPDFSAGLNLDKAHEDYSFRMWILKEALILTDQSSITSAVLNFTEWTRKRDSLTNTHLALHCKEKVLPGYVPTFPNADTSKKVGTNSYSFAKSLPDLLSEFSFRQQITSHASGLLLASRSLGVSMTFSSSGTVLFPSAKSHALFPAVSNWSE